MENIILVYKTQEAVIKLFNDNYSILFEAKHKTVHGKEVPTMSAHVTGSHVAHIVKVSNCKFSDHSNLKTSSPKQVVQKLPMTLAQVKSGNTFEKLLNEIRQAIYSLYRAKENTKKVCNNIMNSIKL